LYTKSNYK